MKFKVTNEVELTEIAPEIIAFFGEKKVILFRGEMGVGKTTLIKVLGKALGVSDNMSSPTFSIVNEYETNDNSTVYHFDFYRLNTEEEALDFGYEDYFYRGNFCFIEWPEKIPNLLPSQIVQVNMELDLDNNRQITVVS